MTHLWTFSHFYSVLVWELSEILQIHWFRPSKIQPTSLFPISSLVFMKNYTAYSFFFCFFHHTGLQISQVFQRSHHPPRPSENLTAAPRGVHVEGRVRQPRTSVLHHCADLKLTEQQPETVQALIRPVRTTSCAQWCEKSECRGFWVLFSCSSNSNADAAFLFFNKKVEHWVLLKQHFKNFWSQC